MKPLHRVTMPLLILFVLAIYSPSAADDALSAILLPKENWEGEADTLGFTDGLACDKDGNLFFSDLRAKPPAIYAVEPDGTLTKFADASRSGLEFGSDGLLYACGSGKIASYDIATRKETILAENLQPNDLAVSSKGFIYFTETGKKQVTMLDPKTRTVKAADTGISKPNGITLSPDQSTLYVSDYGGLHVYAFRVQPDGTLADKKALMTMKAPEKAPQVAAGDGMTTDTAGRVYVTTALGLQIFDHEGKLLGILPKPKEGPLVSVGFAGKDHDILYLACGDTLYKRKVRSKGK
jgi:enterochelin esterase family protein